MLVPRNQYWWAKIDSDDNYHCRFSSDKYNFKKIQKIMPRTGFEPGFRAIECSALTTALG
jgi:hypothetical protein